MIHTKLFIGCPIKPDLRIRLNQSLAWKQSRLHTENGSEPAELSYQKQDYLGFSLATESAYLADLRLLASKIQEAVHRYCDDYPVDNLQIYIFPQIFVS